VSPFKPVIPLIPVIDAMVLVDIVAAGRPLTEGLAAGVLEAREVVVIIVVVGIMLLITVARGMFIMGTALVMEVGICIFIMGITLPIGVARGVVIMGMTLLMDIGRCTAIIGAAMGCCMFIMGIIILGAPPGGLAEALMKSPKSAHVARAARIGACNVRNICLSPSKVIVAGPSHLSLRGGTERVQFSKRSGGA